MSKSGWGWMSLFSFVLALLFGAWAGVFRHEGPLHDGLYFPTVILILWGLYAYAKYADWED